MDITPPYGYQEVVALTKEHRVVLPAAGTLPPVFHSMMVIPLSYSEFSIASHDYPVVFVSGDQGKSATAMAVVGLEQKQNLFVALQKSWDNSVYVPAYALKSARSARAATRCTMPKETQRRFGKPCASSCLNSKPILPAPRRCAAW
jgi:SapC